MRIGEISEFDMTRKQLLKDCLHSGGSRYCSERIADIIPKIEDNRFFKKEEVFVDICDYSKFQSKKFASINFYGKYTLPYICAIYIDEGEKETTFTFMDYRDIKEDYETNSIEELLDFINKGGEKLC